MFFFGCFGTVIAALLFSTGHPVWGSIVVAILVGGLYGALEDISDKLERR